MKLSQICALVLLVVVASAPAFADSIHDPQIIIKGSGGGGVLQGPCSQCVGVGFNFKFTVPEGGSGTLFFTNQSGKDWTSLKLIETGVPAADIKCHSDLFMSCAVTTLKNGSVQIFLSGVGGNGGQWKDHGIPNGGNFAIQFACVGQSCWPGGLQFGGHGGTGTVPEPATVGLLITGLGAIFSRRKRWITKTTA